ncbi:hypothetical protein IAT38_000097 [Cryptococcus sp. DSM 104549]
MTHYYAILPTSSPRQGSPPPRPLPRPRFRRHRNTYLLLISLAASLIIYTGLTHSSGPSFDAASWGGQQDWAAMVEEWLPTGGGEGEKRECKGWDPEKPEEQDPVGCLKARQWRQTQRVLEREIKKEHLHWWFTRDHNIATLQDISKCFLPVAHPDWKACHEKPLIVSGWWYTAEVITGATTGEVIWQSSVTKQLSALGYSFIAVGPYGNWQTVAEMMPDVYHIIWNNDLDTVSCVTDPRCVAKEHYTPPEGAEDLSVGVPDEERGVIPLWALNIVDYWGAKPREISHSDYWWNITEDGDNWSPQPLGQEWIATPWALPKHQHLPYSIEETCLTVPVVPPEERRNAALLFAKRSSYFKFGHVSPPQFWTNLSRDNDFDLILTATVEDNAPLPEGLETLGKQTKEEFVALLAGVKAMVGMGAPAVSPSVYNALCQATPVVLPYFFEEKIQSEWRHYSGWSQHAPAMRIGEPYVYGYKAKNYTDLERAVKKAMSTPIERYIPEDMRLPYALSQLRTYLARPLQEMMAAKVEANGGKVSQLTRGMRERCTELKRCSEPFEVGRRPASAGPGVREVVGEIVR